MSDFDSLDRDRSFRVLLDCAFAARDADQRAWERAEARGNRDAAKPWRQDFDVALFCTSLHQQFDEAGYRLERIPAREGK